MVKKLRDLAAVVAFAEAGHWKNALEADNSLQRVSRSDNRKFIIVSENKVIQPALIAYAMSLSLRTGYDVVAAHVVNKSCSEGFGGENLEKVTNMIFEKFIPEFNKLESKAARYGAYCTHLIFRSSIFHLIEFLHHKVKKVEFAVVQAGYRQYGESSTSLPVFIFK